MISNLARGQVTLAVQMDAVASALVRKHGERKLDATVRLLMLTLNILYMGPKPNICPPSCHARFICVHPITVHLDNSLLHK